MVLPVLVPPKAKQRSRPEWKGSKEDKSKAAGDAAKGNHGVSGNHLAKSPSLIPYKYANLQASQNIRRKSSLLFKIPFFFTSQRVFG